jgi:hypothetical protein
VSDLLTASSDPEIPFRVQLSDELKVNPTGPISYVTPVRLFVDEVDD